MAKFDLKTGWGEPIERLSEKECRGIAARALATGLLHSPASQSVTQEIKPPAGKRGHPNQPRTFKTIPVDWDKPTTTTTH